MFSEKAKKEELVADQGNKMRPPLAKTTVVKKGATNGLGGVEVPKVKRKTARDLFFEDILEYLRRPNPKRLTELRE